MLRLTLADMLAAARLHNLAEIGRRRTLAVFATIVFGSFGIGQAIAVPSDNPLLIGLAGAALIFAYLCIHMMIARMVFLPFMVRRAFREQRNLHEDYNIIWNERSYTVIGVTVRSETPWGNYLKWREDDRVLLLYLSSGLYQVLPKRALSAEAVSAIRENLERDGVTKGPLFLG